jgi:hypothetical protein
METAVFVGKNEFPILPKGGFSLVTANAAKSLPMSIFRANSFVVCDCHEDALYEISSMIAYCLVSGLPSLFVFPEPFHGVDFIKNHNVPFYIRKQPRWFLQSISTILKSSVFTEKGTLIRYNTLTDTYKEIKI